MSIYSTFNTLYFSSWDIFEATDFSANYKYTLTVYRENPCRDRAFWTPHASTSSVSLFTLAYLAQASAIAQIHARLIKRGVKQLEADVA